MGFQKYLKEKNKRKTKRIYFKLLIRYLERMEDLPEEKRIEYIEFLTNEIDLVNRKQEQNYNYRKSHKLPEQEDTDKEYVYSLLTTKYITIKQIYAKSDKHLTIGQIRHKLILLNNEGRIYRIYKWKPNNDKYRVYKRRE